jgi:hypothetical protein
MNTSAEKTGSLSNGRMCGYAVDSHARFWSALTGRRRCTRVSTAERGKARQASRIGWLISLLIGPATNLNPRALLNAGQFLQSFVGGLDLVWIIGRQHRKQLRIFIFGDIDPAENGHVDDVGRADYNDRRNIEVDTAGSDMSSNRAIAHRGQTGHLRHTHEPGKVTVSGQRMPNDDRGWRYRT